MEDYGLQVHIMSIKVHIHNSGKLLISFHVTFHLADVCFGIMSATCLSAHISMRLYQRCDFVKPFAACNVVHIFYHLHARTQSST